MGTAVTARNQEAGADSSSADCASGAGKEGPGAASACHSFWEGKAGTGAEGVEGAAGLAQQAGVEQWQHLNPQHAQTARDAMERPPAETVKTLCQTRRNPSR